MGACLFQFTHSGAINELGRLAVLMFLLFLFLFNLFDWLYYFYIHMFIFISGLSAIIMAFLGCCTSKVPDRCCVMTFCMFSLLTFAMFSVFTIIMITLNLKN